MSNEVGIPLEPRKGASRASATSPIVMWPLPSTTSNVIGTRSTATTSPISAARSATAPPSCPVNTLSSAECCSSLHRSSTSTAAFQLPASTLPGMCTDTQMQRSETSTPCTTPRSTIQPKIESQVPSPSGSSPTQHGHNVLHVQTSSSLPSTSYVVVVVVAIVAVMAASPYRPPVDGQDQV